jgi:hypothetical protein
MLPNPRESGSFVNENVRGNRYLQYSITNGYLVSGMYWIGR